MNLAEWYINESVRTGLTQGDIADAMGVNRHTVNHIIHGRHVPRPELAMALEKYTGGKVKAWDMIVRAIEIRKGKKKRNKETIQHE